MAGKKKTPRRKQRATRAEVEALAARALELVLKSNKRRNLTSSQRACLAAEYEPIFAAEARKRQATSGPGAYGGKPLPEKIPEPVESRVQAGTMFGVNERYVSDAKKLKEESPDKFEEVRRGEKKIVKAVKELKKEKMLDRLDEQAQAYGVPENPDKPGEFQWEALGDDQAGEIITSALADYLDPAAVDIVRKESEELNERIAGAIRTPSKPLHNGAFCRGRDTG